MKPLVFKNNNSESFSFFTENVKGYYLGHSEIGNGLIRKGMTPQEISEIVSERLIDVLKEQLEKGSVENLDINSMDKEISQ